MDQPHVYEKSLKLVDSEDCMKQVLMSCIIYSAQYHPVMSMWLNKIIEKCCNTSDQQKLLSAIEQLIQDINRQNIYGPNSYYRSVSQRPHFDHLDSCFIRQQQPKQEYNLNKLVRESLKDSWILQFIPLDSIQQILWYKRSNYLKLNNFVNKKVSYQILKQLQVNGQSWIKTTPLPTLILVVQKVLRLVINVQQINLNSKFYISLARLSFLHNRLLQNPAKDLCDQVLKNYRRYINIVNKNKELDLVSYVSLLLEYLNVLTFYYKYSQGERIIQFCKQITNLSIQFTGKMGRRTKYQSFDTAQLVMNIKNKDNSQKAVVSNQDQMDKDAVQMIDAKQLILKEIKTNINQKDSKLQTSTFDEQNILLQKPIYTQEQQKDSQQKVEIQKILVVFAAMHYMWQTNPKDQIVYQHIATSIQTLLQHKQNLSYSLMFSILLLRSLNEFPRTKNAERALDQLQKMKANFNEKTLKDVSYMYASSYIPFVQFIKILAQKYIEIGMTMSAIQLYQKIGMIEQCIDGLIARNFKQKALNLAQKYQKQNGKTPRLLCMLGDLQEGDKCVQYYQQAWKMSERRNARSQRSLGWHYFRKKQYAKAAESFKLATQANFYHPNTWFTLGCCYLQLKQFQKAVPAFGQCVCIDDTQGEAWGNIATCYIYQNRYKEAYSTLEQALKHSENNWKMWSNMLSVSLKLKKFYKYFQCVEKLVQTQKSEIINSEILRKVINIFQHLQQTAERRRLIQAMKNRLDRLYTFLVQKIGQNPIVWHSIHEYNIQLQNFTIENYKHYKKLHEEQKIDKNDLLEGYQSLEQLNKNTSQSLQVVRSNILSSKQTQLNMTMRVGWQYNKVLSQQVATLLQEYINIFQKYGKNKDQKQINQFKLFINGVRKKVQTCLERSIQLKSTLL